jgi:hypothetical protein
VLGLHGGTCNPHEVGAQGVSKSASSPNRALKKDMIFATSYLLRWKRLSMNDWMRPLNKTHRRCTGHCGLAPWQ